MTLPLHMFAGLKLMAHGPSFSYEGDDLAVAATTIVFATQHFNHVTPIFLYRTLF